MLLVPVERRARPKAWVLALDLWGSGNRPDKLKQRSGGVSVRENVANAIQLRVLVLLFGGSNPSVPEHTYSIYQNQESLIPCFRA
jgi:hypothetical protein